MTREERDRAIVELRDELSDIADRSRFAGRERWHLAALDALIASERQANLALRNVRMLSLQLSRGRDLPDAAEHLLRFCEQGGVPREADIMRDERDLAGGE